MRKIILILISLLVLNIAFAAETKQEFDITNNINQGNSEIIVPQGQNATTSLPMFSRSYLRIFEGTKLDFNIVDPDTEVTIIKNSLIVKEITPDATKLLLSIDGKNYQEVNLIPNKDYQINYTYKFMPFMILKQVVTHYENTSEKRNIVLFFNAPFLKPGKSLSDVLPKKSQVIDPTTIQTTNSKNESKFDTTLIIMFVILIILVAIIFYLNKSKKSKHH